MMKRKKKERVIGRLPSKAILRNFLNHFETLESRRKYDADDDLYQREFQSMKELTETLKTDVEYSCSEGLKEVNRHKNRYKDILPYDYTRVILSEYPGVPGSDYINANYVRGSSGSSCAYIASQGPLPNTVVDFWRMIWESEVTVIVMACNETESGKYKCECYWSEQSDTQQQYGNITVELVKWRQVCPDFLVRTLRITSDSKARIVCQFHYTTWPDHGVPSTVQPILELVRLMRDVQPTETRPILIHCSAGCGRTGTICSIDFVWNLLRSGNLREDFSLYNIICDMRKQRIAMVQTQEQYMLCYRAVAALIEQRLKLMDAHTYENVDEDGKPLLFNNIGSAEEENGEETANLSSAASSSSVASGNEDSENESSKNYIVEPTKDVKHLIDAWNINNIRNQEKETSSQHDNYSQSSTSSAVDSKQEKLVGKATVIRRPSIAKLKALFENITTENGQDLSRSSRSVTLHRSFSTRERSSTIDSIDTNSNLFNFSTTDMAPFSTSSFTLNQIKSKTTYRPKNKNYNCRQFNTLTKDTKLKSDLSALLRAHSNSKDVKMEIGKPIISQTNESIYSRPILQAEPIYSSNPPQAPPKPPRTYQYPTRYDRSSNESPAESSTGGGIGGASSTSSEKYSDANRVPESSQRNAVESDLFSFNSNGMYNGNLNNQNFYSIDQQPFYRGNVRNASESNLYEPTLQISQPENVRKELSKSSYYLAPEPIYYEPPPPIIGSNTNKVTNVNENSSKNTHERNVRREVSASMLRHPIPSNYVPKSQFTNREIKTTVAGATVTSSSSLIHSLPKYPLRFDQNRNHPGIYQTQRRPVPMNYVRPQLQPTNSNNSNGANLGSNATNLNKNNTNSVNVHNNVKSNNVGNEVNKIGMVKSNTVSSIMPTPASSNTKEIEKQQLVKSKSVDISNQVDSSKSKNLKQNKNTATSSNNKSANEATAASAASTASQKVKKQGSSFASFFSFGRKKKPKPASQPTTGPIQPTLTNTVPIRPPHSHRFSPPTQWTQV